MYNYYISGYWILPIDGKPKKFPLSCLPEGFKTRAALLTDLLQLTEIVTINTITIAYNRIVITKISFPDE
jgi:hypothetical protein